MPKVERCVSFVLSAIIELEAQRRLLMGMVTMSFLIIFQLMFKLFQCFKQDCFCALVNK